MKLVFILLDACKSRYITQENMPFIFEMSKKWKFISKVIPSPGFCERSEIFTGLNCFESGNFTAIGFASERGEYPSTGSCILFSSIVSKIYKRGAKYILQKYRQKHSINMRPYYIPPQSLFQYCLTEDSNKHFMEYRTIFDELKEAGRTYIMDGFTSLASNSEFRGDYLKFVSKSIEQKIDFVPLYFGITDIVGHKYGDDIKAIRPYLMEVDSCVEKIAKITEENGYALAVLGDHGMIPISEKININRILKKEKIKNNTYEVFLDSTIARFWFWNNETREKVYNVIKDKLSDKGIIVDSNNYRQYGVPLDICAENGKPIYGELLWCANPGILIWPDYFNNPIWVDKGMHGYLSMDNEDGTGFFITTFGNEKIESARLNDICSELCHVLSCKEPNKNWRRKNG